jgi:arylsulfatase A-like enzyme
VRALLCALLLTLTACHTRQDQVPVVHDLVAELPAAEIRREVEVIDFGSPAARSSLRAGWYQNERGRHGRTIVWSRGQRSDLEIWLAAPRPLRATVRCAPLAPPDGRPQTVTVLLNGRRIGELSLRPQLSDYAFDLPVEAQAAGPNLLEFQYRRVMQSRHRQLAVSWDLLRLTPGPADPAELPRAAPRPGGQAPALLLPSGTEAGYYLALEGGGTLALEGVRGQGHGGGALQVLAQEEGGQEKLLETLPAGTGPRSLDLPGRGERLVRLALRAVPGTAGSGGGGGGLVLLGPAVRGLTSARRAGTASGEKRPERPNLILYLIDTLRADRVGATRAGEPLTPNIDAFARESTVFENAIAQAPWTRPSVASIFTGLGPLAHGVQKTDHKLPPEAITLAERLHAAGYGTAAFSTNWHVHKQSGLDQGFAFFDFSDQSPSDQLNERVVRWLDTRPQPPFLLYVHALDPHSPYTPPPEYRKRFAPDARAEAGYVFDLKRISQAHGQERRRLIAELPPLYDAEVAFNDHSFGAFLDALRRRGLYEKSLIVLVSDHGEEFDEHGDFGHANNLYNETLNIPLIVKWPGQRQGKQVRSLAQHVDLLPTLLRAAGLQTPHGLPGIDLAQIAASGEDPEALAGRRAISHLHYRGREGVSVVHAGWKLIHPLTRELSETSQLYRRTDPAERTNRLGELPVRAGWLESLVRLEQERSQSGLKAQTYEMDEETRRALEALGYL